MKSEQLFYPGDVIFIAGKDSRYVITRAYFQESRWHDRCDYVKYKAVSTNNSSAVYINDQDVSAIKLIERAPRYYRVNDVVRIPGYLYNNALRDDNQVHVVIKGIELKDNALHFFVIHCSSTISDDQDSIFLCSSISLDDMRECGHFCGSLGCPNRFKSTDDDDDDDNDNDGCQQIVLTNKNNLL